ncbi:hypothetical protein Pfo_030953 [Paulownia fortunei]|nr:hypothetical protein Pfo_030953 [Paulownia fortunei]
MALTQSHVKQWVIDQHLDTWGPVNVTWHDDLKRTVIIVADGTKNQVRQEIEKIVAVLNAFRHMLDLIKSIIIGIVEGLTEFLPVSSTGHIILAETLMKIPGGAVWTKSFTPFFDYAIQLGAIFAVIQLYFNKLNPFSPQKTDREKFQTWRLWIRVAVGVLPAVVFGLLLNDFMDAHLLNFWVVSAMLIIYVLSLVPGTSRSGATILGAIILGASRFVAAEFSFFLSIPVMFGVTLLKMFKFFHEGGSFTGMQGLVMLFGFVVSWIVALFAIKFMMNYIKNNDFKAFGYYRIIVGVIFLLLGVTESVPEKSTPASNETINSVLEEANHKDANKLVQKTENSANQTGSSTNGSSKTLNQHQASLLALSGAVEVSTAAEFVEAWNNPAVTKITVTTNIDLNSSTPSESSAMTAVNTYMQTALVPRANNIEITSNGSTINLLSSTFIVRNIGGTNSRTITAYYGLPLSTSIVPDVYIHDLNFTSSSAESFKSMSDFRNSILYRNTTSASGNIGGTLTLSNVVANIDNNTAINTGNTMSGFVVPGMNIELKNHVDMKTRGAQLMGANIHADASVRYRGIHDNVIADASSESYSWLSNTWSLYANYFEGSSSGEFQNYTNTVSKDITLDKGAKAYLSRLNFGSENTAMSYQNGAIDGAISNLNINGTLVMTVKDDAFVFQSRRGSSATMLTTKINVNSGGILAINGTNTSASANYGGVVQAAGNLVRGEFNIADDASFYLKSADGGQTFHVPTRVDKASGGIVFNVNSPKYMLIANNKTQSTTSTAGSDWTGYTTGYLQVNVHHSDVSFYRSGNDYNSGTHQSYNVPSNHTSWDRVGIAGMTQYADSGSTGDNYYSLKETPTTNVTGSKANLSDNAYYRVFEIQSYVLIG